MQCGVPLYGKDIRENELPQETGQEHALHFTKGCYVGPEIVERIRSRGIVHRVLAGFVLDAAPEPAAAGEQIKIQHEGKDVGYITSCERVPVDGGEKVLALGFIRREAAGAGTRVQVGNTTGSVAALPFAI